MQQLILLTITLLSLLGCSQQTKQDNKHQKSPIPNYTRTIDANNSIVYHHTNSHFSFKVKKLIDTENYYYGGMKDTYDDPYIATILTNQTVLKHYRGTQKKTLYIVFNSKKQQLDYLEKKE
jgi:hypothetical protein